jgi:hypothetical protein
MPVPEFANRERELEALERFWGSGQSQFSRSPLAAVWAKPT